MAALLVKIMKEMTKNEYIKFVRECANKLYSKAVNYSFSDFKKETGSVKVLPFELSMFKLPGRIEKWINAVCVEEEVGVNGELVLTGRCPLDSIYTLAKNLELKQGEHFGACGYFYSDGLRMMMDFAEGDIYIILCKTDKVYRKLFEKTKNFYVEEMIG